MLHYEGSELAMSLGQAAKFYLPFYHKEGEEICKIPFFDIEKEKKRYVKFERLAEQWVFVDLVD